MKKIIIVLIGLMSFTGCSKVAHLDQLLTLKALSDEQAELNQYIKEQDAKFDLMLEAVKTGTLDQYSNKRKVARTFGDPVFMRKAGEEDGASEVWLYRYATKFFGAQKVYLYFDPDDNLVKYDYIEGENGESEQETASEDEYQKI